MSRGIRVYELARELDVHSKDILQLLQDTMNIELNNHMSTINDQVAAKVRRLIAIERGEAPVQEEKPKAGPAAAAAKLRPVAPGSPRPQASPAGQRTTAPVGPRHPAVAPGAARPAAPASGGQGPRPGAPRPMGQGVPAAPPRVAPHGTTPASADRGVPATPRPPVHGTPRPAAAPGGPHPGQGGPAGARPASGLGAPRPAPAPGGPRPGQGGPPRPGQGGPPRPGQGGPPRPGQGGPSRPGQGGPSRPGQGGPLRPGQGGPAGARPGGPRPGGPRPAGGRPGGAGRPGAGARPGARRPKSRGSAEARRERARAALAQREAARRPVRASELTLSGPITVGDLAQRLGAAPGEVIKRLFAMGVMAAINQELDVERATAVAEDFGVAVSGEEEGSGPGLRGSLAAAQAEDDPERLRPRPPVIAVLGHVDHGKTTLLDAIRETRVAEGEAGGITQHIGASVVEYAGRTLVFLDTPGHEAFTAMRARGAMVTDIAVLVVAADDGIMPQTMEAADHVKAAGVPIVVAVNKVDRPNANVDRVMQQLSDIELVPEGWGGDTIVVPVSALRREGLEELMEMLLLVADVQELKADPERRAVGAVIEARLDKGRGPVATVLVQTGSLKRGDPFVCGAVSGRVRAMLDDLGRDVKQAGPSMPVEVVGFNELPGAGDLFEAVADERTARELGQRRAEEQRRDTLLGTARAVTLAEFHERSKDGATEDLKVILKADVQGSLEALRAALDKAQNEEARAVVIHAGVGPIGESDVMLAAASGAVVLGFNVRPDAASERESDRQHVEIKTYRVIYELLDDVQRALAGKLAPKFEDVGVGRAEVRTTFKVPNVGVVAGCYVQDGIVRRGLPVRLVRDGTVVYEGVVGSLKRFKEDVREVAAGYECGIGIERFNDIKEGDMIEVYEQRQVART